jgi:hypothetical protein
MILLKIQFEKLLKTLERESGIGAEKWATDPNRARDSGKTVVLQ